MDELTRYILHNYDRLMTSEEQKASFVAMTRMKFGDEEIPLAAVEEDLEVRRLAQMGKEELNRHVVERIMKDHGEAIVLNRCPDCSRLVATPKAKQCLHCGWDWHDPENPVRRGTKK